MCPIFTDIATLIVNLLAFIKDHIEIIPTSIGVWLAYQALTTWKKEHIGKKRLDLAAEVISRLKKIEDLINDARDGFVPASFELKKMTKQFNLTNTDSGSITYLVPYLKLEELKEKFDEWYETSYEARSYWPGIEEKFLEITKVINQIKRESKLAYEQSIQRQLLVEEYNRLNEGDTKSQIDENEAIQFIHEPNLEKEKDREKVSKKIDELDSKINEYEKVIYKSDYRGKNKEHEDEISKKIQTIIQEISHKNNVGEWLNPKHWYKLKDESDV